MVEKVIIRIAQGTVRGQKLKTRTEKNYYSFHAIPYAKPPVGPLRFKPPEPIEPWDGIRDALEEGSMAPQISLFNNFTYAGNEDCLFINVFSPKLPTNSSETLLPVIVYIHGGGFFAGSGNGEMHGPDPMMSTQEVVLVTMNYRLGPLGFLCTGDTVVPGNNGLKDQVLALKWIQQNIAHFGGDPRNVTIAGISAGGGSVHLHVVSPMSKGLFHHAIAQSGVALCPWTGEDPSVGRSKAFRLGEALGCKTHDSKELVEFLRKIPAKRIIEVIDNVLTENEKHPLPVFFLPVIEKENKTNVFLPDRAINLLKNGMFNKVPTIIGVTSREGLILVRDFVENPSWYESMDEHFEAVLSQILTLEKGAQETKEISSKVKTFYFGDKQICGDTLAQTVDLYGDTYFNIWAYRSVLEQQAKSSSKVYFYKLSFEGTLGLPTPNVNVTGVNHGGDLGYLFDTMFSKISTMDPHDENSKMSSKYLKLLTNFAKSGNPTPEVDELLGVTWNPVATNKANYLNIDKVLTMEDDFMKENMEFWSSVSTPWD